MLACKVNAIRFPQCRTTLQYPIRYCAHMALEKCRPFECIPRPLQLPLLGNWHLYKLGFYKGESYHRAILDLFQRYGPIVYEKIGPREPVIHVFDPSDVETVYRNEDKTPKIFPLNEFVKSYRELKGKSAGLGHSNDDEWYRLISGIRSAMLKTSSVRKHAHTVDAITDDLVEEICKIRGDNGQVPDLKNLLARWSQEIGGKICLGKRLGYLSGANLDEACDLVEANMNVFKLGAELKFAFPFYQYFVTPKMAQLIRFENKIHEYVSGYKLKCQYTLLRELQKEQGCITELAMGKKVKVALTKKWNELQTRLESLTIKFNIRLRMEYIMWHRQIREVLSKIEENGSNADDELGFVRTLLEKEQLKIEDIVVISMTLFTDGLSTTVPVLMNNLYALAVNPEVQEKVYQEICAESEGKSDADSYLSANSRYLRAVIKETFRMYPNGTEVARINKKPLILSNYYIPAETRLSMNVFVHFRSEEYFPQAEEFKPERWLKGDENSGVNPFLATPFGFGARTCAGRKFAEQDLLISLRKILKHFRLTYPTDGPCIDFSFQTLLFPQKNLPVRFISR